MSDEIKQIAALIGHHQAVEKRVSTLTEEFQAASAQLQWQSETLSKVIRELDNASGNMTEIIRKSVDSALTQVEKELKQAGLAQQKPAVDAFSHVSSTAKEMIHEMRREMSRYTWKSAIGIAMTILFVMASLMAAITWFMDDGYGQIAMMQAKKAEWEQKAPLANISTCDGKPCVQVTGPEYTNKDGDRFYLIKKK